MSEDKNITEHSDGLSLEDILAEYKGEAYIAGEKKLPVSEMHERSEAIMREETAGNSGFYTGDREEENSEAPVSETKREDKRSRVTIIPFEEFERIKQENEHSRDPLPADKKAGGDTARSEGEAHGSSREDTPGAAEEESRQETEKAPRRRRGLLQRLFNRNRKSPQETESSGNADDGDECHEDDIPEDEPALKDVYRAYSKKAKSLFTRSILAGILCAAAAALTFLSDTNFPFSKMLAMDPVILAAVFLVSELLVMALGFDIILSGLKDIFTLKAGAESLATISCIASLADAASVLLAGDFERGLPFCAVASCSVFFSLVGAFNTARGYMLSFRAAATFSVAYCVTSEDDRLEGGSVLVKSRQGPEGFVTKSHMPNLTEKALVYAAPVLIFGSIGLSLLASVGKGEAALFFRCFAAISAAAAPFSLLMAFGHPFKTLAARLSAAGAAVAGWRGASDIGDAVGTVIRDDDLFPPGTLSISAVNIVAGTPSDKVLSYAGSMIMASGSGLSGVFEELIKKQRSHTVNIQNFSLYEGGGLSGSVGNDRILVGSSGFMNLMGIRVQESMNIKNAVFCAINGSLAGVFLVEYNPTKQVHNALVALLSQKMMTLFAIRDFNITTMMLRQKFKIPSSKADKMDVLTFADRYRLSDPPVRKKQPSALVFREGLAPYANAVLGGRSLQLAVRIGTVISLLGAGIGVALMFFMCNKGAYTAATAANTLIFMLAWLLPTFLLSKLVN